MEYIAVMMMIVMVILAMVGGARWMRGQMRAPELDPVEQRRQEMRELHFAQLAANNRERRRASQGGWMSRTNRQRARK